MAFSLLEKVLAHVNGSSDLGVENILNPPNPLFQRENWFSF